MVPQDKRRYVLIFRWLGFAIVLIPLVFQWYISDNARLITLIREPYPLSVLGSIAYQIVGLYFLPITLAIACFVAASSFTEAEYFAWVEAPFRPRALRHLSLGLAIGAICITLAVFVPPAIWK